MTSPARVRVWDAPVRIVHWLIVAAVAALWWTGEHDDLEWHRRIGYGLVALLVFRLAWGLFGASTARFSAFVRGPRAVLAYAGRLARGEAAVSVGHNPMGGWSVVALLTLLVAETALGLFASDTDSLAPGPLARFVDYDTSAAAAHWHGLVFNALLVLIGLHLAAIAFYALVRRDNLIWPMVTGARADGAPPMTPAPIWRALAAVLVAAALAAWTARGLR